MGIQMKVKTRESQKRLNGTKGVQFKCGYQEMRGQSHSHWYQITFTVEQESTA